MKHRSSARALILAAALCISTGAQAQESAPDDNAHDLPEPVSAPTGHHAHAAPDDGPPTYFAELIAQAVDEHPAIQAQSASVEAEQAQAAGVGLLPDPSVSLSANSLRWNAPYLSGDPMAHIQLGVSQPLWWPGELSAMKSAAEARAHAAQPAVDEARVELLLKAAELYYDIYSIDRRMEALRGLKPPIEQLIKLLTARISTGKATVSQVERARLALLRVDDDIFLLQHQRPGLVAKLNALLNRAPESPVRPPPASDAELNTPSTGADQAHPIVVEVDPQNPLSKLDELVERGIQNRPIVESMTRQKAQAKAEADATKWSKYPRLEVFGSWEFYAENPPPPGSNTPLSDGTDAFSVGISSTIPLWSGAQALSARDEASARAVAADAEIAQFRLQLRGEIAEHLAELHHLHSHIQFYKDELIPQADRALSAALAGLDAGRADLENWLAAEQRLSELHATLANLQADILKHQAITQALIGEFPGAAKTTKNTATPASTTQRGAP